MEVVGSVGRGLRGCPGAARSSGTGRGLTLLSPHTGAEAPSVLFPRGPDLAGQRKGGGSWTRGCSGLPGWLWGLSLGWCLAPRVPAGELVGSPATGLREAAVPQQATRVCGHRVGGFGKWPGRWGQRHPQAPGQVGAGSVSSDGCGGGVQGVAGPAVTSRGQPPSLPSPTDRACGGVPLPTEAATGGAGLCPEQRSCAPPGPLPWFPWPSADLGRLVPCPSPAWCQGPQPKPRPQQGWLMCGQEGLGRHLA